MESDPVRGKTIRWKYDDGPVAGKSFEHTFGIDGVVAWTEIDGRKDTTKSSTNGRPKTDERPAETKAKYEVAPIKEDVYAVSYLAASGFTLTSVLDFSAGTVVSFASNEKQLFLQRGTFEVEERVS
jgi:hypothetical protein